LIQSGYCKFQDFCRLNKIGYLIFWDSNTFSLKNWIKVLLILVRVDSYFERFPEKDDKVPPIRNARPEKIKINPIIQ